MKTITIELTAEDVQQGVRHSCTDCPIALALRRHVVDGITVMVSYAHVSFWDIADEMIAIVRTTPDVQSQIAAFDRTGSMRTGPMSLEIPERLAQYLRKEES